ncbi:hypothetical protein PanWU01x14_038080, partial [Parasponia andersonii]
GTQLMSDFSKTDLQERLAHLRISLVKASTRRAKAQAKSNFDINQAIRIELPSSSSLGSLDQLEEDHQEEAMANSRATLKQLAVLVLH